MDKTNIIKCYTTDTIIIARKRGWRSKVRDIIKSFPPAGLESPTRRAVIQITISLNNITVTKTWR